MRWIRDHLLAMLVGLTLLGLVINITVSIVVSHLYLQQRQATAQRTADLAANAAAIAQATTDFKVCVNHYAELNYMAQTTRQYASTALRNAQQDVIDAQQSVTDAGQVVDDGIAALITAQPGKAQGLVAQLGHDLAAKRVAVERERIIVAKEKGLKRKLDVQIQAHPYPLSPKVACP